MLRPLLAPPLLRLVGWEGWMLGLRIGRKKERRIGAQLMDVGRGFRLPVPDQLHLGAAFPHFQRHHVAVRSELIMVRIVTDAPRLVVFRSVGVGLRDADRKSVV